MDKTLLNKYWEGETSLQEEAELMKSMAQSQEPESAYFAMIAEARRQKSKLTIADVYSYQQQHSTPRVRVIRPLYRWMASAAAVALFVLAAAGLWQYSHRSLTPDSQMAETFDDPYEAYEEMREALAYVSARLNQSQSEALINIQKAGEYAEMFK